MFILWLIIVILYSFIKLSNLILVELILQQKLSNLTFLASFNCSNLTFFMFFLFSSPFFFTYFQMTSYILKRIPCISQMIFTYLSTKKMSHFFCNSLKEASLTFRTQTAAISPFSSSLPYSLAQASSTGQQIKRFSFTIQIYLLNRFISKDIENGGLQ